MGQKGARDPHQGALQRHPPPVQPALPLPGPVSLASVPSAGPGDEIPFPLNEFDPPAPPPWPPGGHAAPSNALSATAAGRAASGTLLDMADCDWQSQVSAANSSWQGEKPGRSSPQFGTWARNNAQHQTNNGSRQDTANALADFQRMLPQVLAPPNK